MTPEHRSEWRMVASGPSHGVNINSRVLLALLDELDELDPSRHSIMGGWLVIATGQHNCGTGPGGHFGAHEPGCGLEQAVQLDNLPGWPGDERDRLATAVERVQRAAAERTEPPYAWESADGWSDGYDQAMNDVRRALGGG